MATTSRFEELMALTAPNTSGVDARAVIPALAQTGLQHATTYAYGMGVQDAQREGQLGMQNLQNLRDTVSDAANRAMTQDMQLKEQAAQAHRMLMSEKDLAFRQQAHADSMAMAQKNFQLNMDKFQYQKTVEGQRMAMEQKANELKMEADQLDVEKNRLEIGLLKDRADAFNAIKDVKLPVQLADGSTKDMSVMQMTAIGMDVNKALGNSTDPKIKSYNANRNNYISMGISPNSATLLAGMNINKTVMELEKNITADINAKSKNLMADSPFGQYEITENGQTVLKEHTAESYRTLRMEQGLRMLFADLPEADREIMVKRTLSEISPKPSEAEAAINAGAAALLNYLAGQDNK